MVTLLIQNALEESHKQHLILPHHTLVNVPAMVQDTMKDVDHPAQTHLAVLVAGHVGFLNVGSVGLVNCLPVFRKLNVQLSIFYY